MNRLVSPVAVLAALLVSSLAATGCGGARDPVATSAPATQAAAPAGLRLVVLVVIDQLPAWSFDRDRAALTHGIGRLLAEGTYFTAAEYPYANSYTASGHAALSTGATPRVTGIIDNRWYDDESGKMVDATMDPTRPTLSSRADGVAGAGQSSHWLRAAGVADVLARERGGRARAIAVSLKPRAAILVAGQASALSIWYDDAQRAMTTSQAYGAALPPWLAAFDRADRFDERLAEVWQPGDPALLARLTGNVDDGPGEGLSEGGLGHTFPHVAARAPAPAEAFEATPASADLVFDTAEAAIAGAALGADDVTDYLAISISSHDYAGHAWGQESWERTDLLLRIDRRLGELLTTLDRSVGADRYAVVLTGDHGGMPMVEQTRAAGKPAFRVRHADVLAAAERGAARVLGPGTWTAANVANSISMSATFRARPEAQRRAALDAVMAEVKKVPGIGLVAASERLAIADCAAHPVPLERLACESIAPGRTGEVFAAADEGSLMTTDETTGTGHGTPSALDRTVPLIVRLPGHAARRDEQPVSMLRVAPTLARLLGVSAPPRATAPALDL